MNVEQRQAAADPQTKPSDLGDESACGLLSSSATIAVAVRKLFLANVLAAAGRPHRGRRRAQDVDVGQHHLAVSESGDEHRSTGRAGGLQAAGDTARDQRRLGTTASVAADDEAGLLQTFATTGAGQHARPLASRRRRRRSTTRKTGKTL